MSAEARLKELGLVLPNLLFLAGQGPRDETGAALTGKLGAEISIDEGYRHEPSASRMAARSPSPTRRARR